MPSFFYWLSCQITVTHVGFCICGLYNRAIQLEGSEEYDGNHSF
ncbi:hypothetical protein BRIN106911_03450 [Brevibacillus invocatus]